MVVDLYTDGACSGNPGPGGWGWVTEDGRSGKGGAEHTTNQRMEVQAVLEGLNEVPGPVNVVSDSTYVVKCFNDRWFEGWKKRGWKNSQKKPVANQDLWEPLIQLYLDRENELSFTWVKGHSGNKFNEIADQLAVEARDAQSEILAGAQKAAAVEQVEVPWPIGNAIWAIGPNSMSRGLRKDLADAIARLGPQDILISGLRRGVELEAAELALKAGHRLGVVLPFADPATGWPSDDRSRFDTACAQAAWLVTLAGDAASPGQAVEARNLWLQAASVGAIVVDDQPSALLLDEAGLSVVQIED